MIEYNKRNIPLAKNLRKNMTRQERKLWYEFLREYSVRVQRQKAIGEYIVDFYCAKAQLVIEIDGSQHCDDNRIFEDAKRTEFLNAKGLKVLRISNLDIDNNFEGACEYIDYAIKYSLPQSADADSSLVRGSHKSEQCLNNR